MTNNKYELYNVFTQDLINFKQHLDNAQKYLDKISSEDLELVISSFQNQLSIYKIELENIMKNIKNKDLGDENILFFLQSKVQDYDHKLYDLSNNMKEKNINFKFAS